MSEYWLGQLFTALPVVVFLGYWVRRTEREHKERMAEIDARAAAHEAAFEARKRAWDEENAKARAAADARIAALRAEFPELDALDQEEVGTPGGA